MLRNRRFGVEIECNFNSVGTTTMQRSHARTLLRELANRDRLNFRDWDNVGYDGSGIEVRSPILQGASGFRQLKDVMQIFSANEGSCNVHDGMHVHHDAPEFVTSRELSGRLVRMWLNNERIIESFVASNRVNSWACPKNWSESRISELEGEIDYYGHKLEIPHPKNGARFNSPQNSRGALNLRALSEHGSIEFRLHEGTLDFQIASAWIRFGQALLDSALKRKTPLRPVTGPSQLLKSIRVAKVPSETLLRRSSSPIIVDNYDNEDDGYNDEDDDCDCEDCRPDLYPEPESEPDVDVIPSFAIGSWIAGN